MLAPKPGTRRSLLPVLVTLFGAAVILAVLEPRLLLTANTPAGGDMGAHVYAPAYLREVLLPQGRVHGWSNEWFAGFPLFYFYFPLPSLVIVALDLFLPYGVAFKLVTVAGLLFLPVSAYVLARALRQPVSTAAIASASAVAFVFMESFNIYGGNIASTLAGEFSYSWSFALGFLYLALLIRATEGERRLAPWAALVFALAALSHILTIVMLLAGTVFIFRRRGSLPTVVSVWVVAGLLTAFWALPLVLRIGYSTDMAWTPLSRWDEIFPIEIWLLLPAAIAGAIFATRRSIGALPIVAMTLIPLIYYPLPSLLPDFFPDLFTNPRWKLWNGRLLPYWYFGVTFLAAIGVGHAVSAFARRLPELVSAWWARATAILVGLATVLVIAQRAEVPSWAPWAVGAGVLVAVGASMLWVEPVPAKGLLTWTAVIAFTLGSLAGLTFVNGWARWNYTGYEGKESWAEYSALMATLDTLPEGRTMWEYSKDQNRFGTTMALMLIPYWTEPGHGSMEGLFFESSLTVPFHFLNQSEMSKSGSQPVPGLNYRPFDFGRGIPHLQTYGVRYYISYTEEATVLAQADNRLSEVAASGPFTVFEIEGWSLVEPATFQPAVLDDGAEDFGEFALEWYDDIGLLDKWVVADGPDDWPRVESPAGVETAAAIVPAGRVSDVELGNDSISFSTTAVGVPHLVKISYFPNWKAEGAAGPYRATPSLMVVVPTEERVELTFGRTWVEYVGTGLSVLSAVALAWWFWKIRTESPTSQRPPHDAQRVPA